MYCILEICQFMDGFLTVGEEFFVGQTNGELECENDGYCEVRKGAPRCICQEGYGGERCQFEDVILEYLTDNGTGH